MSRETDQEFSKFQADAEQNEAEAEREALAKKQKADEETLKSMYVLKDYSKDTKKI